MATQLTKEKPVEVLMPKEDRTLLKELYLLRSYSGFEEPTRRYIERFLSAWKIPYLNYNGNIIGFNHPGAPLFSAHMDMVNTESYVLKQGEFSVEQGVFTIDTKANIRLYRDAEKKHQTSLGADDKNGIWVILTLLKCGYEINFAFCHSEEVGGTGSQQIISNKELAKFIAGCKFGIVIDRRNADDIIGYDNKYCLSLDDRISAFAKEKGFGFKPATGSCSDADKFSQLLECVNLSCGYYSPHTSSEYTNVNELWKTFLFCQLLVDEFNYHSVSEERMKKFKGISTYSSSYYSKCSATDNSKTTYNYSNYWEKNKEPDKPAATEQKKISKTTTETVDGQGTTTTHPDIMKDIDTAALADALIERCTEDWKKEHVAYVDEIYSFVLPMYTEKDLPKGTTAQELAYTSKCPQCGKDISIVMDTLDALWMSGYDEKTDGAFALCTGCHYMPEEKDIKTLLRHIL